MIAIYRDEIRKVLVKSDGDAMSVAVGALKSAMIKEALIMHRGNITRAAKTLGINRGTLRSIMKELDYKN